MHKKILVATLVLSAISLCACSNATIKDGLPEDLQPTPAMAPVETEDKAESVEPMEYQEEVVYQEEAAAVEEPIEEAASVEEATDIDLRYAGVVSDGDVTYTWYSERVLPGGGLHALNSNGRTLDDRGFVTDGEGYIAIASPDESIPIGTEVDTPWGTARVYDYNPGDSWDVYTGW